MNNTMTNYLLITLSLYITVQLIRTTLTIYEDVRESMKIRERKEQFVNNHPEMKGVDVDEDELMVFTSGERIKDRVMMNDDDSDNTPLMTKLMDEFDFDEDDD